MTTIQSTSEDPILVAPCRQETGLWKLGLDYEILLVVRNKENKS
jgi:hypothetical protein